VHQQPRPTWIFLILLGIGWTAPGVSNEAGGQHPGELAERPLVAASQPLLRTGAVHAGLPGPLDGASDHALDILASGSRTPTCFAAGAGRHPEPPQRFRRAILGGRSSARAPPLEIG
jgi:hypothetical protein